MAASAGRLPGGGTLNPADAPEGLVTAQLLDGCGGARTLDWDGVRSWLPEGGVLWVHLDYHSERAQQWLAEEAALDPVVVDALLADETRPRAAHFDSGLLVNLRGVNSNPGADPEDMVSIRLWLEPGRVISTRHRRLLSVHDLREALAAGEGPRDTASLLGALAERLVARMAGVLEGLEARIDGLEDTVADDGAGGGSRRALTALRREAILLRRYLYPQRDALVRLHAERLDWLGAEARTVLRESADQVTRYLEDLDAVRERAGVLSEELAGREAEALNRRMYLLSIVTAVFLPLGFLTGLLGINVGGIPGGESAWGFAVVLGIVAALGLGQVIFFRWKRWL